MKKIHFLASALAVAALSLGFTACSSDDSGNGQEVKSGEPTSMTFSIEMPKTRVADGNATADEVGMTTATVLIYQKIGVNYKLENKANFDVNDFDYSAANSKDVYKLKNEKKITTTTGDKMIYAGLNLSPAVLAALPKEGSALSELSTVEATFTSVADFSTADNFPMFTAIPTSVNLVPEAIKGQTEAANTVEVNVKRFAAKLTAQSKNADYDKTVIANDSGFIHNLTWAIGNINKTEYVLQNIVAMGGTAKDRVQSTNWINKGASDFLTPSLTSYNALEASTIDVKALTPYYVSENTNQTFGEDGNELTYVSFKAEFVPNSFSDENGNTYGGPSDSETPAETFWVVELTNGKVYYFKEESAATTFTANRNAIESGSAKMSLPYLNGVAFWRGYINANAISDQTLPSTDAGKYDVLRNTYYQMTLSSISGPGKPSDEGKTEEATTVVIEIVVEPWQFVDGEWNVG